MCPFISQLGLKKTLSSARTNIGNPIDQRRTRSDFQRAGIALSCHDSLLYDTCYLMIGSDLKSYYHARKYPIWKATMDDEFNSLQKNATWDLVSLPPGRKLVQCKCVFWKKKFADGKNWKYKAKLFAKGFSQVQWVDYHETFSPMAKMDSIRLVLSIAASKHWEVHHMDVKSAFIHGDLHEEIYMKNPKVYISDPSLVIKLYKSLYGLKQTPRSWYAKMDASLLSQNFQRWKYNPNVYL